MDEWLELTRTPDGQRELRRRRRSDRVHAAQAHRRSIWGSDANYRAWQPVQSRLNTELGLSTDDIDMLAAYARSHSESIDPVEVADLMAEWCEAKDVPGEDIVGILRGYHPRTGREQ